jgi:N-acetylneuraminate synthase
MVGVIAEIGQNHSGSMDTAIHLIDMARAAGCDYVKFQVRTLPDDVPEDQRGVLKETPWGVLDYVSYRSHLEFGKPEFDIIADYCKDTEIPWFASVWGNKALDFLLQYDIPFVKVPSAKITDIDLLRYILREGGTSGWRPILSTGMSTPSEIRAAVTLLYSLNPIVMHCTSTYPCPPEELNLHCVTTLMQEFPDLDIGYSGHETGLATTVAAVALGATMVERHVTLDRASWGSDQAASVEGPGLKRLVKDIRTVEKALGDGVKKVEAGEIEPRKRLRGEVHATNQEPTIS